MKFEDFFNPSTTVGRAFAIAAIMVLVLLFVFTRRRRNAVSGWVAAGQPAQEDIMVEWKDSAGGQLTIEPWMTSSEVTAVFDALTMDGKEARFVGGCVRNALMHVPVTDIDIATQETPDRVINLLEGAGIRAIPTGIAHGTVTAVMNGKHFEITTLRRDVETDGRRAVVAFSEDWREDAVRRDVERVRLAEKPFQLQHLEIEVDAESDAFGADALMPAPGVDDMQMHVGLLAMVDLVGGRKADRPIG